MRNTIPVDFSKVPTLKGHKWEVKHCDILDELTLYLWSPNKTIPAYMNENLSDLMDSGKTMNSWIAENAPMINDIVKQLPSSDEFRWEVMWLPSGNRSFVLRLKDKSADSLIIEANDEDFINQLVKEQEIYLEKHREKTSKLNNFFNN